MCSIICGLATDLKLLYSSRRGSLIRIHGLTRTENFRIRTSQVILKYAGEAGESAQTSGRANWAGNISSISRSSFAQTDQEVAYIAHQCYQYLINFRLPCLSGSFRFI